jgi:hypothetical protein
MPFLFAHIGGIYYLSMWCFWGGCLLERCTLRVLLIEVADCNEMIWLSFIIIKLNRKCRQAFVDYL